MKAEVRRRNFAPQRVKVYPLEGQGLSPKGSAFSLSRVKLYPRQVQTSTSEV